MFLLSNGRGACVSAEFLGLGGCVDDALPGGAGVFVPVFVYDSRQYHGAGRTDGGEYDGPAHKAAGVAGLDAPDSQVKAPCEAQGQE